jgi:hypothetical protein
MTDDGRWITAVVGHHHSLYLFRYCNRVDRLHSRLAYGPDRHCPQHMGDKTDKERFDQAKRIRQQWLVKSISFLLSSLANREKFSLKVLQRIVSRTTFDGGP